MHVTIFADGTAYIYCKYSSTFQNDSKQIQQITFFSILKSKCTHLPEININSPSQVALKVFDIPLV